MAPSPAWLGFGLFILQVTKTKQNKKPLCNQTSCLPQPPKASVYFIIQFTSPGGSWAHLDSGFQGCRHHSVFSLSLVLLSIKRQLCSLVTSACLSFTTSFPVSCHSISSLSLPAFGPNWFDLSHMPTSVVRWPHAVAGLHLGRVTHPITGGCWARCVHWPAQRSCRLPGVAGGRFQLISSAGRQLLGVKEPRGGPVVAEAWPAGLELGVANVICPSGCQRSPLQQDPVRERFRGRA